MIFELKKKETERLKFKKGITEAWLKKHGYDELINVYQISLMEFDPLETQIVLKHVIDGLDKDEVAAELGIDLDKVLATLEVYSEKIVELGAETVREILYGQSEVEPLETESSDPADTRMTDLNGSCRATELLSQAI